MPLNKVFLQGNLTRDPDLKYLPNGNAVINLSIACNRKFTDSHGQQKEEVYFGECKGFGKVAENLAKFFKKGSPILVEGRLTREEWDDKATGAKRSATRIVLDGFQFCGDTRVGHGDAPRSAPADSSPPTPPKTAGDWPVETDDVPF
jgi:single-strand DNA-binding protein